ncbi:MAG TPA: SRPBCC family protein [Candidatus Limnocylindria bacterium]|jgi:uncharacterized protein YndB with AHSA1/START domain|nr:SRPBCC family protein [Candidatus Limnocylindria bacterium]
MDIVRGPTFTVHVSAPPDRVYAYVADFLRHPEWSPDDMKIESQTPGPSRVGSRFKAVGTLQGKRNSSELEITAMEPSRRIVFTATDKSGPIFHTFTFTPENGGTRVDRNLSAERMPPLRQAIRTLMMYLLVPLAVRPNFMKALNMMKANVEGKAAA